MASYAKQRYYSTRRLAYAAMWRALRKANRKSQQVCIAVQPSPFGYYLKQSPMATSYSISVIE
jgi:hypothetical protein